MHIHSSAGVIRAGGYDKLSLTGRHEFSAGVHFVSCDLSGFAVMHGCHGASLVCRAAHIHCQGDMNLETLRGYGDLVVTGSLHCKSLRFTGRISVEREFVCEEHLEHTGRLHGPVRLSATTMRIIGALEARDVSSVQVTVNRLSNAVYLYKLIPEYRARSVVHRIMAESVHLENATCECIHADRVTLEGCYAANVSYARNLSLDRSSHVSSTTLIEPSRSHSYRRRA